MERLTEGSIGPARDFLRGLIEGGSEFNLFGENTLQLYRALLDRLSRSTDLVDVSNEYRDFSPEPVIDKSSMKL